MKVLGIVIEANPFHNGHKYFIDKCIEQLNPDLVIAITSTSFTMRGELSLLNKFDKAKILLNNGVDIVIELPFSQAVQSADFFAKASINNLNQLNITDIAFGCECTNKQTLEKFVKIIQSDEFKHEFSQNKSFSLSLKDSYSNVLSKYLNDEEIELFNKPNMTLGLQYLKVIKEDNLNINYHIIKRVNNDYNDKTFNTSIASATSIRYAISNNIDYQNTLPSDSLKSLIDINNAKERFINIIKYKYLVDNNLDNIFLDSEGINNYIKNNGNFNTLESLQDSLKNKRYSINRINRTLLYSLLNIKRIPPYSPYVRILGINNKGLEYIKTLPKETKEIVFSGKKELKKQNNITNDTAQLEMLSTKLYSLIVNDDKLNKLESQLPIRKE